MLDTSRPRCTQYFFTYVYKKLYYVLYLLSESNCKERRTWSRNEILKLIDLYKDHKESFDNSNIKKEKVWQKVSSNFKGRTMPGKV